MTEKTEAGITEVKPFGLRGAHVIVPVAWIGEKVAIVRLKRNK